MKKQKPLRVGFDLDGVILYNPIRAARPIIAFVKHKILRKKKVIFYIPKSGPAQWGWHLVHRTSIAPAHGIDTIARLIKNKKIEAYIITGRYSSLSQDFEQWMKRLSREYGFTKFYSNKGDEQPNAFKERMIRKLDLDVFVEDNWDIVQLLTRNGIAKKTQILWITNFLDRFLTYAHKHPNLNSVAKKLQSMTD